MIDKSTPRVKGESLIPVAVSNQIINRTAPAMTKSLCFLRNAGNGLSKAIILLARLLTVPIGQREHQNRAHTNAPIINTGHPTAQLKSAAGFFMRSAGPRNRKTMTIKKNGVAALCRTAGKSGLLENFSYRSEPKKIEFTLSFDSL